jgi:hypothetical protein
MEIRMTTQKIGLVAIMVFVISGCTNTSKLQVVVDPATVVDKQKYDIDAGQCIEVAKSYDLTTQSTGNAAVGAVAAGGATAGVATAVAGAVFAPAIPFIIAASLLGGGVAGDRVNKKELAAREKILADCLKDRGYKVYSGSGS